MQNLLTLSIFGSFIGFLAATLAVLAIFFYAEYKKQGFIALVGIITYILVNHYWGNVSLKSLMTIPNISIYLGAGLVYAVIRTYFHGRSIKGDFELDYEIKELKGNVFRWWFIWPVSLLSWVVTDFLVQGFELVWANIGNSFKKILTLGFENKNKSGTEKSI